MVRFHLPLLPRFALAGLGAAWLLAMLLALPASAGPALASAMDTPATAAPAPLPQTDAAGTKTPSMALLAAETETGDDDTPVPAQARARGAALSPAILNIPVGAHLLRPCFAYDGQGPPRG